MKLFKNLWRLIKKYYYKMIRADGTPHAIALGFAIGMFLGTAIPLGQAVLAILFAILLKANKIVAFAVTWVSNPYTTPFMYLGFCYVGSRVIGEPLSIHQIEVMVKSIFTDFTLAKCWDAGFYIIISYIIGGTIIGGIASIISYFVTKRMVIKYRYLKKIRKEKRKKEAMINHHK